MARQTALMNELKGSAEKLSSLNEDIAVKARQTLLNRNSCLPDLNAIQQGVAANSEQELLVELISSEVSNYKKDMLDNYMKIAEKTEKELQTVDGERTQLLAINARLAQEVKTVRDQLRLAIEDRERTELNLNHYMVEFDAQAEQLTRVRENYEKYEKLHSNIERQLKGQLAHLTEESDAKIAELREAVQKLTAEKTHLLKEKTQNVSAQITNEEYQKYQSDQIAELTLKNSKLALENEEIRGKNHRLVLENTANLDKVNLLQDEIHRLTNEYEMKIDQVTKSYELKLKAEPVRKQTELVNPGQRFSDLYSLQIPDHEGFNDAGPDMDLYDRDRTTSDLDRLNMMRNDSVGSSAAAGKQTNLNLARPPAESTLRKPTNLAGPTKPKESTLIAPPKVTLLPSPQLPTAFSKPKADSQPKVEAYVEDEYSGDRGASGPNFLVG